ncbi:ISAs1 family transposase [Salinivibrio sp. EAGSL]|uniref:ISAs1 family transposase n=1 Tax=Salinivibrio sp. EAGSL TaxID=2738468 RepID=UPI00158A1EF9|nr:ISAs1 family transposase [Salinivibrio sp. EAGSL]
MDIDTFKDYFSAVDDHRQSAKITYPLFDLLFASLCAVIAGSKGWYEIREYILGHHEWFKRNGMFEEGIPADDTIARAISAIEPSAFQACFIDWMKAVHQMTDGQVVAIDGKTLKGSYNREDRSSTIHMVSAYASENHLVLGQLKTEEKSNEISAIPELIRLLDLRGALVTIDAMACQTTIAKTILEQGGDYLLAVKQNQGKLANAITEAFSEQRRTFNDDVEFEYGHGRIESRQCYVLDKACLSGDFTRWPSLQSLVMVESLRVEKGRPMSLEYRYYISSKSLTADKASRAIRSHWGIEAMHWVLDVNMGEDACQIYKDNGAANFACLRHMASNMVRAEPTKISLVAKQKRCLMNPSFLEKVLAAGIPAMVEK